MSAEAVEVECVRRPNSTWTRCRCATCRADQRRLDKRRKVLGYVRTPWQGAWEVLTDLVDAGWSGTAIADAYDLPVRLCQESAARHLAGGTPRPFGTKISARLLAPPVRWPRRGLVPAIGITRRLQALAVLGHTNRDVIDRTGLTASVVSDAQSGRRPVLNAKHAGLILAAYEDMYRHHGASTRAAFRARKNGWYAPADWEYADIDDPSSLPEDVRSHRVPEGRNDAIRLARGKGRSVAQIAEEFECSERTVERALRGEKP